MVEKNVTSGDRIFIIRKAYDEANTDPTFDECLDTVVGTVDDTVPRTRDILSGCLTKNNSYVYDDRYIPVEQIPEDDRERVVRTIKLMGIVGSHHSSVSSIPTRQSLDEAKSGKGSLISDLKKIGYYDLGMSYINGEISLNELNAAIERICKEQKTSNKVAHAGAKSSEVPSGAEKTVKLGLPPLGSLAECREFCTRVVAAVQKSVIGQDTAIEHLVIRFLRYIQNPDERNPILITGPTGCGKTYSLKLIADAAGIPFGRVVVPELTPAGYVGINLQDALAGTLLGIYERVGGKPDRLILQLDEFDKILADRGDGFAQLRQNELLGLLEKGATLKRKNITSLFGGAPDEMPLDALIVLSGAFSSIDYNPDEGLSDSMLRSAGFIDELIGRISLRVMIQKLSSEHYIEMMKLPVPEIAAKFAAFERMGVSVKLSEEAIRELAEMCSRNGGGARKLTGSLDDISVRLQRFVLLGDDTKPPEGLELNMAGEKLHAIIRPPFLPKTPLSARVERRVGFI